MGFGSSLKKVGKSISKGLGSAGGQAALGGLSQYYAGSQGQRAENRAWRRQKNLGKNQLQWRVNDAKRAGIHPLAALGMSPMQYSGAQHVGGADALSAGLQGVQDAFKQNQTPIEKQLAEANLELLRQKAGTEATMQAYYASQAAKNNQQSQKVIPASHPVDLPYPNAVVEPMRVEGTPPSGINMYDKNYGTTHAGGNQTSLQTYEDMYGEPAEWFIGLPRAVDELVVPYWKNQWKKFKADRRSDWKRFRKYNKTYKPKGTRRRIRGY